MADKITIQTELSTPAIAHALKTLRVHRGLTQQALGEQLDLSKGAVNGREGRGISNVDDINEYLRGMGYKAMVVITSG